MTCTSIQQFAEMKETSSHILYSQMQDRGDIVTTLLKDIGILMKALSARSSNLDLEKIEEFMRSIQSYVGLMHSAGQILKSRKNLREPDQMIVPNDMPVAQNIVDWIEDVMITNKTNESETLNRLREAFVKQKKEKAWQDFEDREEMEKEMRARRSLPVGDLAAEQNFESRMAEMVLKAASDATSATLARSFRRDPVTPPQKKLQLGDGPKPSTIALDCSYADFEKNRRLLKSLKKNSILPDGFSPEDFHDLLFDYLGPAVVLSMKQKIAKQPNASWEECLVFLDEIMEQKSPLWGRRIKAFSLHPSHNESMSEYISRQVNAWSLCKADIMTAEEHKMLHVVKSITTVKLREELTTMINASTSAKPCTLDDLINRIIVYEQDKETSKNIITNDNKQGDKTAATGQTNGKGKSDKGDGKGGGSKWELLCNCCNAPGHYASSCLQASALKCSKCGMKEHKNEWSGRCRWNTTRYTIPEKERNSGNPQIKDPGQAKAGGAGGAADNSKPPNKDMDRALALVTQQIRQSGYQLDPPSAPYITGTEGWTDQDREDFKTFRDAKKVGRDTARVTASPSWNQGATQNSQDQFTSGHSQLRATFWSDQTDQKKQKSSEDAAKMVEELLQEGVIVRSHDAGKEEQDLEQLRWEQYTGLHHQRTMTERKQKMEQALRPQWMGGEGFGSSRRRMTVEEIVTAMMNGNMEDEVAERLLATIHEENQKSKVIGNTQVSTRAMDTGVEKVEKYEIPEKAVHEYNNVSDCTSGSHGHDHVDKETYTTQAGSTAEGSPAHVSTISVACTSKVSGEVVTSFAVGDFGYSQENMGGQSSKQSNLVVIENLQKALSLHEKEKGRMQLGPNGFPGGNTGKFMDDDGGYAGVNLHVETFALVLAACGMIGVTLYLLRRCFRKGSCLPAYLRAAVERSSAGNKRVIYYRPPSSPTGDFQIQMQPLEMQKRRYEPEELGGGSGQHERVHGKVYPRLEPKEVNIMGGVGLG